ncbi:hypothetical protein C349_01968 [Cryptococcus neoformans var. grubii Br795]|nr:hypothetical protein C349_01968 [Cryptococcus neoformans var. grubii Br795]
MSNKGLQPLPLAMKRTTRSIALQGVTNNVSRPGAAVYGPLIKLSAIKSKRNSTT